MRSPLRWCSPAPSPGSLRVNADRAGRWPRRGDLSSRVIAALLAVLALGSAPAARTEIVHRERSLYQTILIERRGAEICLQFSIREDQRNQSCIDKRDPRRMVFAYTRMMMAGLLLNPEPKRILAIGLGGGTVPTALAEVLPAAKVDVVEIDPAVIEVAGKWFGFEANDRLEVFTQDARVFTRRAHDRGDRYDLIVLDAYNGDYIPEHLMTREYLQETRDLLAPGGALVANTFAVSRLYDAESATYQSVFGDYFNLQVYDSANRIILASIDPLPNVATLRTRASRLAPALAVYGVEIEKYPQRMAVEQNWDPDTRNLTDQYSPPHQLNAQ
jgi:spermidine synthase